MNRFNSILKNVLLFLVIFFVISYLFKGCYNEEDKMLADSGNFVFTTNKQEYSRTKAVIVEITNNTAEVITIPNECPNEPFDVFRYENNEWAQKTSSPELECIITDPITLQTGDKTNITYGNWNHDLFSEMGRFKIEFTTTFEGEEKTFTTNEFTVREEGLFTKLWRGVFYRPIYNGLIFLTNVLPGHSLGFAIILLTLIIRTILLVPSHKSMKAQKKMQDIQPRLEKIKEKYKGDQQKISMETMALWKEAKVNPLGSCLPLLMQFPFLIAVFYVVQGGLNPDNTYLLYTEYANFGLQDINTTFLGVLDLTKANIYVLPLVIGGLQFIQMKLTMARKDKKKDKKDKSKKNEMAMASNMMVYFMPVMIAVFTASLPAGVGIYWGTSTIYGIFQQLFINKSKPIKDKDEPTVKVIEHK
jgi:YidC/Oxa1 family membrane protein insertase